jgi:hypothetical protein
MTRLRARKLIKSCRSNACECTVDGDRCRSNSDSPGNRQLPGQRRIVRDVDEYTLSRGLPEPTETFTVNPTSVDNAIFTIPATLTATITDND